MIIKMVLLGGPLDNKVVLGPPNKQKLLFPVSLKLVTDEKDRILYYRTRSAGMYYRYDAGDCGLIDHLYTFAGTEEVRENDLQTVKISPIN